MQLLFALLVSAWPQAAHSLSLASLTPKIQTLQNIQMTCDNSEPGIGTDYFTQYINHSDPSQGTFQQKYFWRSTYWGGPGYPVVLMTPGEVELSPYCSFLSTQALITQFSVAIRAAVILIEHRYWGDSSPYSQITTDTLQYITLNSSVSDLVYFARNVQLPFHTNASSNAPDAPWVLSGGSYSGALTAWTAKLSPGTFWAYHASSAPVQAMYNFWQFFSPIRHGLPRNSSRDLAHITAYIDDFVETQLQKDVAILKEAFGLGDLSHEDDFASAIINAIDTWQETSLTSGYTELYQMCDTIHGYGHHVPVRRYNYKGEIRIKTANLARWFKNKFLPDWCYETYDYPDWMSSNSTGCLDTYNASSPFYTDRSVRNTANMQWAWMLCNEPFAYWQTGAGSEDKPTIASRLVTPGYFQRQCDIYFGQNGSTYGSKAGMTVDSVNNRTNGWNSIGNRILWVNGEFDPWSPASVSSPDRPGGPLFSTPNAPVMVIKGDKHGEDLIIKENMYLKALQVDEVNQIIRWVNAFYASTPSREGIVPSVLEIDHLYDVTSQT